MSTFTLDISRFADKAKKQADDLVGLVTVKVAQRLDERSPVGDATYWKHRPPKGYVGGFFRGSWMLGVGSIPSGVGAVDPAGEATLGRIIAAIPEKAAGKVFYIGNVAPYGERIENGWSRQAPSGLVGLTAMEFQQIVGESATAVKQ
jgi:hypothetical protein